MGSDIYDYDNLEPVPLKIGIGIILSSLTSLAIINRIVTHFGPPGVVSLRDTWKWRNVFISWIHALIVGPWCILCFVFHPEILQDLIAFHNMFCYAMVAVSTGYFVYDFVDVVINKQSLKMWEVLVHHVVVVGIFVYNIYMCRYIAFTVVALLTEVNTIFLHSRKLMQMSKFNYSGVLYRVNLCANLATFLFCRFVALTWIVHGIVTESHRMQPVYAVLLSVDMFVMWVINLILFVRIVKSDILRPTKHSSSLNTSSSNGQAAGMDGIRFNNNDVLSSHVGKDKQC